MTSPEAACRERPGNFVKHVASLPAAKRGDGLADPKLVLSWLIEALGAPAWQLGLLVPIREAGPPRSSGFPHGSGGVPSGR